MKTDNIKIVRSALDGLEHLEWCIGNPKHLSSDFEAQEMAYKVIRITRNNLYDKAALIEWLEGEKLEDDDGPATWNRGYNQGNNAALDLTIEYLRGDSDG